MKSKKNNSLKPLPYKKPTLLRIISITFYVFMFFDLIVSPYKYFIKSLFITNDFTFEICISVVYLVYIIASFYYLDYKASSTILIDLIRKGIIFNIIAVFPFYYISIDYLYVRLIIIYRYPLLISKIKRTIYFLFSRLITNYRMAQNISDLLSFLINLFFIFHFFACIYIYLGTNAIPSWLDPIRHYDSKEQYIVCFYILMQTFTTVGFGDYTPKNPTEYLFVMFCLIVNCGLFAYWISRILSIISYKERIFDIEKDKSIDYLRGLPFKDYETVHRHIKNFLNPRHNLFWFGKYPFLKQMKPYMRKKLIRQSLNELFKKFDAFFDGLNISSRYQIVENLETVIVNPNYIPIEEGKEIHKVYFIVKGEVNVFHKNLYVKKMVSGEFFGDYYIFDKVSEFTYKVEEGEEYNPEKVFRLYAIDVKKLSEILSYDQEGFMKFYRSTKNKKLLLKFQIENEMINEEEEDQSYLDTQNIKGTIRCEDIGNFPFINKQYEEKKALLEETLLDLDNRINIVNNQLSFIDNEVLSKSTKVRKITK